MADRADLTMPQFPTMPDGTTLVAMRVSSDPERFVHGDADTLDWLRDRLASDEGQMANPTGLLPLPRRLALVRCDGCGTEWEDLDAAIHQDGYSEHGCPNRCGRLTTPAYWPSGEGWRRPASDEDNR